MADTFKAVDGFTSRHQIETLKNGDDELAYVGSEFYKDKGGVPCTIIPGHWAERIESGELLTEEELLQAWEDWHNAGGGQIGLVRAVSKAIARKLRGEA